MITAALRGLAAATLAAAIFAATASAPARAAEMQVKIDNFVFSPQKLTVKAGSTVTWTNEDDIPHVVLATGGKPFKSKVLDTNDKYSFTFTTPGVYEYFCALHPHMTGSIVVEAATGDSSAQ